VKHRTKIYLDTSVINFLFADDAPEYKTVTVDFFDNYLTEYEVYISEIMYLEINRTSNKNKKALLHKAMEKYGLQVYASLNSEIELLANKYTAKKVIPENKIEDALHIAYATYYKFDILLSWNFKHLANIKKQFEINAINKKEGYTQKLNLLNPIEVLYEK